MEELEDTIHKIKESYYGKVTVEGLVNSALEGILKSLDEESRLLRQETPSLEFVRGLKEEDSIPEVRFTQGDVGYIRIDFFGRRTGVDFKKALEELQGMKALILDLRDNHGGHLRSAQELLENFVSEGKPLFTQVDRQGQRRYLSQGKEILDLPTAILINSSTASSAELVAATLRYYHKGIIVGEKSHSKGTIQEVIPLSPQRTLLLTTGEYLLPDGSSLRNSGVIPDHTVRDKEAQIETAISLLQNPH
jgi:carboxyl-terminal processing protease